jgi:hypothetical protein
MFGRDPNFHETLRIQIILSENVLDDELEFLYKTVWLEGRILIQKKMFFHKII